MYTGTLISNSAFHGAAMDKAHIASEMERFVSSIEKEQGIPRKELALNGVYFSHETSTHATPTSSCAYNEVCWCICICYITYNYSYRIQFAIYHEHVYITYICYNYTKLNCTILIHTSIYTHIQIFGLRKVFGEDFRHLLILNTKGFTGHPMGVSFEDVG